MAVDKKQIGEMIREVRERRGLTQRDLAKIANTSPASICSYKKGRMQPNATSLINLMGAMNYVVVFRPREKEGK